MIIGDTITAEYLIRHMLSGSFEFSAHTEGANPWGEYELNGVGINFGVNFDQDAVLERLKNKNIQKVIFAHTHPLINDESLVFIKGKPDPRKKIAYGLKLLPLGNPPTKGDVDFLIGLKQKAMAVGIEVSALVFSARGIWIFDADDTPSLKEKEYKINDGLPNLVDDLLAKELYPSYSMELEVPKNKTEITYDSEIKPNFLLKFLLQLTEPIYREVLLFKIKNLEQKYRKDGVPLRFIEYKSQGIDPVLLLRSTIEEWEKKYMIGNPNFSDAHGA